MPAQSLKEGQRVIIDMDFEDLMIESDRRHLCQQLSYSYSANKAVAEPLHLVLSSFDGAIKERCLKQVSGEQAVCWHLTYHYIQLLRA